MSKDIPKTTPKAASKAQAKGQKVAATAMAKENPSLELKKLDEKFDPRDKTGAKAKSPEEIEAEKKNPKKPEEASDKIEQFTASGWTEEKKTDSLQFRTPKYPENKEVIKDENLQQMTGNEWKNVEQPEKK